MENLNTVKRERVGKSVEASRGTFSFTMYMVVTAIASAGAQLERNERDAAR
jgi:Na+/H+ antiporter NhaD/arsenite permease-like protein